MAKKSDPKKAARFLKAKGLIPKSWDLREKLTPYRKRHLREVMREYKQLLNRPQDFVIRTVSASTAKILKKSGYKTARNKVVIPSKGIISVRIKDGNIILDRPMYTEKVLLQGGPDFLKKVARLNFKKLKPNQAFALKIGSSPTLHVLSQSMRELNAYARGIDFHSPDGNQHVSLVLVTHKGSSIVQAPSGEGDQLDDLLRDDDDEDEDEDEDEDA